MMSLILSKRLCFLTQMILLWRDPEGNTVSVTTQNNGMPAKDSSNEQMQTIAKLKKSVKEKDDEIARLRSEISSMKEVSYCAIIVEDHIVLIRHTVRTSLVKSWDEAMNVPD